MGVAVRLATTAHDIVESWWWIRVGIRRHSGFRRYLSHREEVTIKLCARIDFNTLHVNEMAWTQVWVRHWFEDYVIDMDTFPTTVVADHTCSYTTYSAASIVKLGSPNDINLTTRIPAIWYVSERTSPYHPIQ
jgi:hypothetical protein